jgi:hypothetical protein
MNTIFARLYFLQNIIIKMVAGIPPAVVHNLGKIFAIKNAFFHCFMERVEGDYVEFGVYEGTSLISAFAMAHALGDSANRKFFGFDSFQGFNIREASDKHPFFQEGGLKGEYDFVQRRVSRAIGKQAEFRLIKGYYEDVLKGKSPQDIGISQAALVLIDCDLKSSTEAALNFIKSALAEGSIIILDDYFSYKGSLEKGVAGAFEEFKANNKHIHFRQMCTYAQGGAVFVVSKMEYS